jgi:hypothetical protein
MQNDRSDLGDRSIEMDTGFPKTDEGVSVEKSHKSVIQVRSSDEHSSSVGLEYAPLSGHVCIENGERFSLFLATYFSTNSRVPRVNRLRDALALRHGNTFNLLLNSFQSAAPPHILFVQCFSCFAVHRTSGVPIDFVLAAKYFKFAADQNHADAQFYYGLCLREGRGVPIDFILSAKYLKLSADQNHSHAQFHYGLCLQAGRGVPIDFILSAK